MNNTTQNTHINILYCEGNIDGTIGGSYFSLLYLVSGLNKNRYNPLVVFHHHHKLISLYEKAGINTLVIDKPKPFVIPNSKNPIVKLLSPVTSVIQKIINVFRYNVFTALQYAYVMKKHKTDLLHLNNGIRSNHEWMLGALLTNTKCITHERGILDRYTKLTRYLATKLKAIICISDAVRNNLLDKGIDPGNLHTVYNAIDPQGVKIDSGEQEIRDLHQIANDKSIIGVIGNIKEWKGQETIIRAMPPVLKKFPNTVCLLVGDTSHHDQAYKNKLLHLINELGIEEQIIFTGYTRNVANYLSVMKIVIHTSIDPEPFGRVLIEGMSMKKPLLGTRAGAVPEIISENVTGYTFPPGDAETLSNQLLFLLSDEELAQKMGKAGYDRVIENFHINLHVQIIEQLYEKELVRSF